MSLSDIYGHLRLGCYLLGLPLEVADIPVSAENADPKYVVAGFGRGGHVILQQHNDSDFDKKGHALRAWLAHDFVFRVYLVASEDWHLFVNHAKELSR